MFDQPAIPIEEFCLDPKIKHLSHGSFGGTPRKVHEARLKQLEWLEASPDAHFMFEVRPRLRSARAAVAGRFGAQTEDLVLLPNATFAMQSILKETAWKASEIIICTNHNYVTVDSCIRTLSRRMKLKVIPLQVPKTDEEFLDLLRLSLEQCSGEEHTRKLLVIDHVSSPGARLFDVKNIAALAHSYGCEVAVDGAHVPGMFPLAIEDLGADYYAGNLHKWACQAHGTAFLWVHPRHQQNFESLLYTYDSERLWQRFEWMGTCDLSPLLSLNEGLDFFDELFLRGIPMRNIHLAHAVAEHWQQITGAEPLYAGGLQKFAQNPQPQFSLSMVALAIPCSIEGPIGHELLQKLRLFALTEFKVELPFTTFDNHTLLVRPSCHAYNVLEDYRELPKIAKRALQTVAPEARIHYEA